MTAKLSVIARSAASVGVIDDLLVTHEADGGHVRLDDMDFLKRRDDQELQAMMHRVRPAVR
jgi:hypothetical protein